MHIFIQRLEVATTTSERGTKGNHYSMTIQFRLQSILKLRQYKRELERLSVASARKNHAELLAKRDDISQKRHELICELRQMNQNEVWIVDQIGSRQRHIEILNQQLLIANTMIEKAESNVAECLARLISADQAATALERLANRNFADFQGKQAKIETRQFDELAQTDRSASEKVR
jgi:flagellar export protein FliJ